MQVAKWEKYSFLFICYLPSSRIVLVFIMEFFFLFFNFHNKKKVFGEEKKGNSGDRNLRLGFRNLPHD